jgi:hypothetical protein
LHTLHVLGLIAGWLVVVVLVAAGIAGNVLPILPGAPLVLGGLLLGAALDGFSRVGWWTMGILGALTVLSMVLDMVASAWGVKRLRASSWAVWGSVLGGLLGIVLGLWGVLLGPFVGAALGEFLYLGKSRQWQVWRSTQVGIAAWVGLAVGAALKIAVAVIMVALFCADLWLY